MKSQTVEELRAENLMVGAWFKIVINKIVITILVNIIKIINVVTTKVINMVTTSRMIINLVANNLDAGKSGGHRAPAQKLCHSQQKYFNCFLQNSKGWTQKVGQSSVPKLKRYYQCTIKEFATSREKGHFHF